jgi:hypothetical protein
MTSCAAQYETNRYHDQVAKSERAALLLEAEARSDIKHNLSSVLDDIDHEKYLRAVFMAVRDCKDSHVLLAALIRQLAETAENEAVNAIVQRGLGRLGL